MGKSRSSSTKQTRQPFEPSKKILYRAANDAHRFYNNGWMEVDPYPGRLVADFSGDTRAALDSMGQGSDLVDPATETLTSIMDEGAMYRDFDTIRGTVADDVKAQLNSQFGGGSINSGLAQDTYTRAIGEALAGVEYGAYDRAQDRRLQAAGLAPSIAGIEARDEAAALEAGLTQDRRNQAVIEAQKQRYYENENKDLVALQQYANLGMGIGGMGGEVRGTTTQQGSFLDSLTPIGNVASGIGGFWGAFS